VAAAVGDRAARSLVVIDRDLEFRQVSDGRGVRSVGGGLAAGIVSGGSMSVAGRLPVDVGGGLVSVVGSR